ncbi:MAG TPA: 1-deoxy-D-xylulose-5-phosphate reductoisomerase [Verrucomicrobiales bacterium]|nr:1-deoxy-D-xylulose-5-phosphate reductoisomerase [Verrucomicrobiales bacterium]
MVLGSTGSIGTSTLKVAREIPARMEIVGLAANARDDILLKQIRETGVRQVCLADPMAAARVRLAAPEIEVHEGPEGLRRLATAPEADLVLVAIVGTAGLDPALAAIEAGKDLAVASKEILVMAGETVMQRARSSGVRVLPVDSEHNAIFQCLEGCRDGKSVRRIILTASGGPFRQWPAKRLQEATLEDALQHPTWEMGRKITIDSATLFNKGLEMIEAHWLFGASMAQIDVVVHPQSIVHSMVEFVDGSVLAQLSQSDMCFPIQYAVTWPDRIPNQLEALDFSRLSRLDFEAPRESDFPALRLARWAGETGGTLPAVLNAANEIAVQAFIEGSIRFPGIWETVEAVMTAHRSTAHPCLEEILEADAWARDEGDRVVNLKASKGR